MDAKRLLELLDEHYKHDDTANLAAEFGRPDWAPRSRDEIAADIQALFDGH